MIKYLLSLLLNESGKGGSKPQTTTVDEPGPTQQQMELINAQLELERQNQSLRDKYGDRYGELEKQELETYASQMNQQKAMIQEMTAGLSPTDQEQLSAELEQELIAKQLGYTRGEIPELLPEEAAGLNAYTQLAKEQTLADVLKSYDKGLVQAKNAALMRGLGSSSYREEMEGELGQQALGTMGSAEQAIEAMKYQAMWDMPRATQTFETGLSELQQAINLQAEQNRASLAANLAALNIQGVNPLDAIGEVQGTRFVYGTGTKVNNLPGYTDEEVTRMNPNYNGPDKIQMPGTDTGRNPQPTSPIPTFDKDAYRGYLTVISSGGNPSLEQQKAFEGYEAALNWNWAHWRSGGGESAGGKNGGSSGGGGLGGDYGGAGRIG